MENNNGGDCDVIVVMVFMAVAFVLATSVFALYVAMTIG